MALALGLALVLLLASALAMAMAKDVAKAKAMAKAKEKANATAMGRPNPRTPTGGLRHAASPHHPTPTPQHPPSRTGPQFPHQFLPVGDIRPSGQVNKVEPFSYFLFLFWNHFWNHFGVFLGADLGPF